MAGLAFDEVSAGDELPEIVRTVDQETFWKFAVASFDYNPVHCDPSWVATARPFTLTAGAHATMPFGRGARPRAA
ncbi:MAG: hypothetical protein HY908_03975 [Myxococcales bacterium]|nr:hypothetical protein [Myxococcales bacterium]